MADLKEILGEELATQIEGVIKEKGVNLIVDNKEKPNFIPKSRFDEVIGSKNELKTQVGELSSELESLKKSAKGNDELVAKIEELQKSNTEAEARYNKNILENAIKMKAIHEKAKDPSDLSKFLDYENLSLDENGEVKGLEEQIAGLKESKTYLFEDLQVQNNNTPANPAGAGSNNKDTKQSIKEQYDEMYIECAKNPNNRTLQHKLFNLKAMLKKQ